MACRKGELTKKRILADWPHHVEIPVPECGLGSRLNAMHEFCRGRDYRVVGAGRRSVGQDAMLWCFSSQADAAAFEASYNSGRT